jgi:hypothetical protein
MMLKRIAVICLLFTGRFATHAQTGKDTCTMEISLLTCAPGSDLYSIFGHTAIRVRDSARGMDVVYNYGTFDDTDPLFYAHFTKGIMLYSLSAETFDSFMVEYQMEHRSVLAQVLDLNCREKMQLYEALRKNTLDENRIYNYHFHTDNCTTRAARIIESNTAEPLIYHNILPKNGPEGRSTLSFRDMIHEYLDKQQVYWPEMGIDFLLGSNLDKKPTNLEAIHFLPDYLYRGMDSAVEGNKPMVLKRRSIISFPATGTGSVWFTPVFVFTVLFLLALFFFLLRNKPVFSRALLIFDISFFTLLGLIGLLMASVWLGRVDNVCRNNINILWALPTHLIAIFFIRRKAVWIKYYFLTTAIIATVLLLGFPWWFQRMNMAVLPLLGIIIFRSLHIYQNRSDAAKSSVQRRVSGV